ncbi:MAG TPA: transglycosylase domain-containing protein [Streptosporangiaceae bacterium]|nr:transglycosylase domain-containing protein [Streptosporangiaceae bacterium]
MQIPVSRAGALPGTVARLLVMTAAAAVLLAAAALPVVGLIGIAARDTANTFNTLTVGTLGVAPSRSVMYTADGRVITYLYPNHIYRVPVAYDQIAPVMRDAIVAIEDSGFFQQGALDPRGTIRALLHNSGSSGLQGASTLAQQYVKNVRVLQAQNQAEYNAAVFPNLQRKIQQLRIAANIERQMTQDQLLAAYLNVAFFSHSAYGIEVASEVYFSKHASQLTLTEAALLAGLVQAPSTYDPVANPATATDRRAEVLSRMEHLHYISKADELAAAKAPLGLKMSSAPVAQGCAAPPAAQSAFFCDYVQHVLEINYPKIWQEINTTGGLAVYTTLNSKDQRAANNAVNNVQPPHDSAVNPGHNADTEVLIQPGTGAVRAIAVNRIFTQDYVDYAVNTPYGGGVGVQTGSSSKVFTLVAALEQGYPFGHAIKIKAPATVGPYTNCQGQYVPAAPFVNAEGGTNGQQIWMLNQATVDSVNLYYANLEQQVGLCNVVKAAVAMGMTRADGTSLLKYDHALGSAGVSADNIPSFTLGSVYVSPMSMAAAYASLAARGVYCSPQAIAKITVITTGQRLPVQGTRCHRNLPAGVADAANYVLQGVLTVPGATAANRGIPGYPAAAKTGTADRGYYAAFAGYTPTLAGYVSVFNPLNPTGGGAMVGSNACYRDVYGESCQGQMFGDMAPGATWQETFTHAALGAPISFVGPPGSYFSLGNGLGPPKTVGGKKPPKKCVVSPGHTCPPPPPPCVGPTCPPPPPPKR